MARICVVTLDPEPVGGVQTRLLAFLRYAASRGHVCDIFYPATRDSSGSKTETFKSLSSVGGLHPVRVYEHVPHYARGERFTRGFRPVHTYDVGLLISGTLNLGLAFARHKKPFVAWISGTFASAVKAMPRTRLRYYYLYNRYCNYRSWRQEVEAGRAATLILPVSRYSAADLRRGLGLGAEKMQVVPGPIDVSRFRAGRRVTHPRPYILSVSRLQRGKGSPDLLRAFRLVVDRMPELELRLVGNGKELLQLKRLARRLGIREQVVFTGELRGPDLEEQYRGASLFALASHREAFGNVMVEALACGLPVVTSDCGGVRDPIVHGVTGLLVPIGDQRNLAESMLRILGDSALAGRLSSNGRAKAVAEYGLPVIGRRFDAIFQEVLAAALADPTAEL